MKTKEQILESVDKSWDKDLIIRYLSIKTAPFFQRDLSYFMADDKTKYKMFTEGMPKNLNIVICHTICEQYKDLFGIFGIESQLITTNEKDVPHYALIVNGNNDWYLIDPLKDLMNHQVGLKSSFYGIIPQRQRLKINSEHPYLITLPKEYIEEMDRYLHLLPNGMYLNTFFDLLHERLTTNKAHLELSKYFDKDISPKDTDEQIKAKISLMNDCIVDAINIPGLIERSQFYTYAALRIFNHCEAKKISKIYIAPEDLTLKLLFESRQGQIVYEETKQNGFYTLKKTKKNN